MFAKTGLLLLTAAAGVVRGDFMVYTEPPIPTSAIPTFANPSDAQEWTTSVFLNAQIAYGRFTESLGEPYQSSLTSARSEIDAFVSTASNYSIPAEVTMADETPTYFSKPDWYTALPSAARSFKEQQVSDQFSIVRNVIAARATSTTGSEGAAMPTALAGQWLGAEFGVMAAAAAAAFFNALVFLGGLGSGPHTTHYLRPLNDALESASLKDGTDVQYSIWELRMRSSYTGFGHGSLEEDAEDLRELVEYLKEIEKEKVVLIGSSTGESVPLKRYALFRFLLVADEQEGCQAIMAYATTLPAPPPVDGYIMQAPTSDRETAGLLMPQDLLSASLKHAEALIAKGEKKTIMPSSFIPPIITSPVTAYRWHSLISFEGDDDFFSSDLPVSTLQSTFGKLDKPTLILMSEKDEMVPSTVDKDALLKKWIGTIPDGLASKQCHIIPFDADHELSGDEAMRYFIATVVRFLEGIDAASVGKS
ncbi:uncharacterized protein J4E84_010483 [Alternaria hordeiaustralica]|uniref:uncharacterized protein n=1 Tax=Alternaria hordeiaustralica TaxID=1187925 RepID=UPI0020C34B60|nr:uncharacterized protein J4E84_010483 [Alternaria hordeiaustralica]KAI4674742.1 hypothetical protein J4E84_010483 [Alternaria hordeiaustralica]